MSPRIMVVNPNTTASMTEGVVAAARAVASAGTEIVGANPAHGVSSVESHVDEVWGAAGVLEQVARGEETGVDAYVIACFGDTGVAPSRELARGPVVGMTEAALMTAALVAYRFTVLTMPRRTIAMSDRVVQHLGLQHRCTVRAVEVPVSDLEHGSAHLCDLFAAEGAAAIAEDGAEAIVLGCAGLSDLLAPLAEALGVPVIDGVLAGVGMAEGLLAQGLTTSRACTYAAPERTGPGA